MIANINAIFLGFRFRQDMYKNRVNKDRIFPLHLLLNFLVPKIKEWEFQKNFCCSLSCFLTHFTIYISKFHLISHLLVLKIVIQHTMNFVFYLRKCVCKSFHFNFTLKIFLPQKTTGKKLETFLFSYSIIKIRKLYSKLF